MIVDFDVDLDVVVIVDGDGDVNVAVGERNGVHGHVAVAVNVNVNDHVNDHAGHQRQHGREDGTARAAAARLAADPISYEKARLIARDAAPEEVPQWIERAEHVTCIDLRRELERKSEAQMCARGEFSFWIPESIATLLKGTFRALRAAATRWMWAEQDQLAAQLRGDRGRLTIAGLSISPADCYISPMEFEVEAALLVNEGGVQCQPVVFARPLQAGARVELGPRSYLNDMPVVGLDPAMAAERGPGLVAFVLEDPMDTRWFNPGDVVRLESR